MLLSVNFNACSPSRARQTSKITDFSPHMSQNLWSYYFNSSSNQLFALIYNSNLPRATKTWKIHGDIKVGDLGRREIGTRLQSGFTCHRNSHFWTRKKANLNIFSKKKQFSIKTKMWTWQQVSWALIMSPLSSTRTLTFLVGFCQKQYGTGAQYSQTDKLNRSLKLLKLRLQRCYEI